MPWETWRKAKKRRLERVNTASHVPISYLKTQRGVEGVRGKQCSGSW